MNRRLGNRLDVVRRNDSLANNFSRALLDLTLQLLRTLHTKVSIFQSSHSEPESTHQTREIRVAEDEAVVVLLEADLYFVSVNINTSREFALTQLTLSRQIWYSHPLVFWQSFTMTSQRTEQRALSKTRFWRMSRAAAFSITPGMAEARLVAIWRIRGRRRRAEKTILMVKGNCVSSCGVVLAGRGLRFVVNGG
jgi:hypothetical protein